MRNFSFEFDKPFFYDLPPEDKQQDELVYLVLTEASGIPVNMKKYSDNEVHRCARHLILKGLLRGTIFGKDRCSWSKPTPKGRMFLRMIEGGNLI